MKFVVLTAAAAAALTLAAPSGAHLIRPGCNARLAPRAELRCARMNAYHAQATLGWARGQLPHSYIAQSERVLHSIIVNHRWLYRTMEARIAQAKRRMVLASYPPHHALWTCLLRYEGGTWSNANTGGNGHYGGLQMHPGWGYGTSEYANNDSQLVQEWAAERGLRASRSNWRNWLTGQWGQTIGNCWHFASAG